MKNQELDQFVPVRQSKVAWRIPSRIKQVLQNIQAELDAVLSTWRRRRRQRRHLANLDDRSLRDLAIRPSQADFEVARKPWQEESGLGKSHEIGTDCGPVTGGLGAPFKRKISGLPSAPPEQIQTFWIDGRPIFLRPVLPADRSLFASFMQKLSDRSRRLRFLVPKQQLNGNELRFLSDADQHDHVAWVAIDPSSGRDELVAEARFVKLSDQKGIAEYAITVADEFQGKGLGGKLMQILGQQARQNGIFTLRGTVAANNTAMLGFLKRRGAKIKFEAPGVVSADLPVAAMTKSGIRKVSRNHA